MWYRKIKRYYDAGMWTKTMVRNAVRKGKISASQYGEITGEPYEEGGNT